VRRAIAIAAVERLPWVREAVVTVEGHYGGNRADRVTRVYEPAASRSIRRLSAAILPNLGGRILKPMRRFAEAC
jgi:hypothetical protein